MLAHVSLLHSEVRRADSNYRELRSHCTVGISRLKLHSAVPRDARTVADANWRRVAGVFGADLLGWTVSACLSGNCSTAEIQLRPLGTLRAQLGVMSVPELVVNCRERLLAITPDRGSAPARSRRSRSGMRTSESITVTRPGGAQVLAATRGGLPQAIRTDGTGLYVRGRRRSGRSRNLRVRGRNDREWVHMDCQSNLLG